MSSKPKISSTESHQIQLANKVNEKVVLIGIRGYYLDSFGKPGVNDRNVYDDVIILLSPNRCEAFRANTDPSVYCPGVATMKLGVHYYYKGKHKGLYWALRLVGEKVPVTRDGQVGDKIGIALNIHRGGVRTTGSLGCQTIQPADWDEFIEIVYDEMDLFRQKEIPYILIDERDRRAGKFKMKNMLSLDDREIDNLLIRFDNDIEPTKIDKITSSPALIPASSEVLNQSKITDESPEFSAPLPQQKQSVQPNSETPESLAIPSLSGYIQQAGETVANAKQTIDTATQTFDYLKELSSVLNTEKDGKKSLWTMVSQIFFQIFWAIFGFFIGLPKEIWIAVAVIVAGFAFFYLYRQFSLGKIRETTRLELVKRPK